MNVAFGSKNPTGVSQLATLEMGVSILLYMFERIDLFSLQKNLQINRKKESIN